MLIFYHGDMDGIAAANIYLENITYATETKIKAYEFEYNKEDSILNFECNNSVIYISSNKHKYKIKVDIRNNSVFYIGENCYLLSKLIFEQRLDILRKDILHKISEKYETKIKGETDQLIGLTMQKYKKLKKDVEDTIQSGEEKFRAELKIKFPNFTNEITEQLVNYYS